MPLLLLPWQRRVFSRRKHEYCHGYAAQNLSSGLCFWGWEKKLGKLMLVFFFRCQQTTNEVLLSYFHQDALNQNVYLLHLDEKQDREGRDEHSILLHVIKTAVTHLHTLAAPNLPIYRSLLSPRRALQWTGMAARCALQADSGPRVVLKKHLKS